MKHPFPYKILYSSRKTLAIQITREGQVLVRSPRTCPLREIDRFLFQKEAWILRHLQIFQEQNLQMIQKPSLSDTERKRYIELARDIFTQKTSYYARILHVTYGRISIREQKTRWGSCSSTGNLNYNWRLIFAPEDVLNYVVVHELAHRIEMNHSEAFYRIVESVLPDYRKSRRWLRENGQKLWLSA